MTTHAQGPPAQKHVPGTYILVTHDQLALPMTSRSASRDGDGFRLSQIQKWVLLGLQKLCKGKKTCRAKDHEIADAVGLVGSDRARRNQVQIALHGRTYRKWNSETGKRDGELVTVPGLCDPALGFVEALQLPTGERELALTSRWLEWNRFRVFQNGNGDAGGNAPVIAGAATFVDSVDEPTAMAGPPPPVAPETAGAETAPPIVRSATGAPAEQTSPDVPDLAGTSGLAPTAPSLVEQPSAEALAEVLGQHFVGRSREDQASRFVQKLLNRSEPLSLLDDGKIKPHRPLPPEEIAVLIWLKPELVELLKAEAEKSRPRPKPGEPPGGERAAPPVEKPSEVRAMIGKLAAQPAADDSDCLALARRLVRDQGFRHNDKDPVRSEELYLGLARQTKEGVLPQAVFLGAFEEACKAKKVNRGSALVDSVKRLKSALRKPDHAGGWTS